MAGENDDQKLWDELAAEREAEQSPSTEAAASEAAEVTNAEVDSDTADPKEEPAKQDQAPAKADPFEGLSPAVKARLERLDALEAQQSQLLQEVKTANGRVAAMQREFDVAKNAAKAVGDAPTAAQIAAAKQSTEKWDALKEDFPEWAGATEQFVKAQLAGITPNQTSGLSPEEVAQLVDQRAAAVRAEMRAEIEHGKVDDRHPGWRDDVKTELFTKWYEAQPQEVKALSASTKGSDAIRLLDLYADAKSKPAAEVQKGRAQKLAAAVNAKPGSSAPQTKSVADMNADELWEYERKRNAKRGADRGLVY